MINQLILRRGDAVWKLFTINNLPTLQSCANYLINYVYVTSIAAALRSSSIGIDCWCLKHTMHRHRYDVENDQRHPVGGIHGCILLLNERTLETRSWLYSGTNQSSSITGNEFINITVKRTSVATDNLLF